MPSDTPEWTGEDPLDQEWPARREAEDPFAIQTPEPEPEPEPDEDTDETEPEEEEPEPELPPAPPEQLEVEAEPEDEVEVAERAQAEHAAGEIDVPDGYTVIEGYPAGHRRAVAIVVSRFNGEITNRMLGSALEELDAAGVERESVTVMPVPGAFELPLGAMALAKTRRYSCIVALGCVIRGETPHFDYVAGESASGLQLAGIETGVPVSFGVLTTDTLGQAEARVGKGAEAVRTALEMADVFAQVRASARG
ncbi:MAG TPA: 6,7-dimethyl-8-ribityllumazine synthase [Gaiellaceae bacterium]|nr:6,7-dimethyl-8-ribityllumazine synthase [Gaiellaceae bacterium]